MFKKNVFIFSLIAAILLVTAGLLLRTTSARAGSGALVAGASSSCLGCHEDLYYNYDTGKHYCLTEASTRCVDCHAGDPDTFDKKAAHTGLVIHPILNGDISRCETCHIQDAQAHADTFASLAGYSSTVHVAQQVQPSVSPQADGQQERAVIDGKAAAGISVVLTVVIALFVFCILTNKACRV